MAQPLGTPNAAAAAANGSSSTAAGLRQQKKKGCKQSKCSKWKGGKCRCGKG